jgi:hypothetical protein
MTVVDPSGHRVACDPQRSSNGGWLPSWKTPCETSPLIISHSTSNSDVPYGNFVNVKSPKFSMLHPEKRSWSMVYNGDASDKFTALHPEKRSWSMIHGEYSSLQSQEFLLSDRRHRHHDNHDHPQSENDLLHPAKDAAQPSVNNKSWSEQVAYSTVFALVNVIIGLPCLYGYATVIFHHSVYVPYWSAISKLIICSSLLFQLIFTCCSALPFVIGAVQDAGLVYLSHMATTIAVIILQDDVRNDDNVDQTNDIYDDDGVTANSASVVLSTALVLLPLGTVVVGAIMILLGYFRFAEYIKLLPMPVVGGYLGFIGFYCFQAGVSLAVSHNLASPLDWVYLVRQPGAGVLALPALLTGLVFVALSRHTNSDAALPLGMMGSYLLVG